MNFRMDFSISSKITFGILVRTALRSQITLKCYLKIRPLFNFMNRGGINIYLGFLNFFQQYFQFSEYKAQASLVTFISKYFIIPNVIVNRTAFYISFSDSLLLIYRTTTDFVYSSCLPSPCQTYWFQEFFYRFHTIFYT